MSANSRTIRREKAGTTESAWVRWTLIGIAMAFMFLFARIVVLTLILFIIGQIWFVVTGREPAFAH